jgi:hypothetical protein
LRISTIALLLLLLASGCARQAEELLPIPASIKGASRIADVEVTIGRGAAAAVAAMDAKQGANGVSFAKLLDQSVREAAEAAGLTSGRALKLVLEVDRVQTASAAGALVGRDDRLEGSAYVRDAATGDSLGQLYVSIDRNNGGFISALSRIGSVRESLARQFGAEVAAALSARKR